LFIKHIEDLDICFKKKRKKKKRANQLCNIRGYVFSSSMYETHREDTFGQRLNV